MSKSLYGAILLFVGALCFTHCKKTGGSGGGGKTFTLSGTVVDESGNAISSATVTVDGQSATAGSDGKFSFSGLPNDNVYKVQASSNSYFTAYKNVTNIDGSSLFANIVMLAKSSLGTLNGSSGGSVGATGLRVIAPTNGFTTTSGTVYTGAVNVAARYIQKANPNVATTMPGGDFLATDQNGNNGGMRTYGFVATEFTDQNGNTLTPNQNVKVAVTVPAGLASPTQTPVNGWGYDATQGKWTNPTTITQSGSEYLFPCVALYQNLDAFIQTGTLTGTVVCAGGNPAAFVPITIQSPYDLYVTITNENGKFQATVEATGGWSYTVSANGGNSVTVSNVPANGTTAVTGLTTSECTNSSPGQSGNGGSGSGQFSYSGGSYSGQCTSVADVNGCGTGIDVPIFTSSGASFILYNIPQESSGSYTFLDGYQSAGNGCNFFALMTLATGTQYASSSGTLTKTGSNSFTFTCQVYDILTNASYSVTGSGNY